MDNNKLLFSPEHESDRQVLLDACKRMGRLPVGDECQAILDGSFVYPEDRSTSGAAGAALEYIANHKRRGGRAPKRRKKL